MPDRTLSPRESPWLWRATLGAYWLLIADTVLWEGGFAAKGPPGLWLAVKGLPLLLMLPGLWRRRLRGHVWASLLTMLYLSEGLVLVWSERADTLALHEVLPWAIVETFSSLLFIVGAAFWVRAERARGATLAP
jgi:uncharacterized membrane protein